MSRLILLLALLPGCFLSATGDATAADLYPDAYASHQATWIYYYGEPSTSCAASARSMRVRVHATEASMRIICGRRTASGNPTAGCLQSNPDTAHTVDDGLPPGPDGWTRVERTLIHEWHHAIMGACSALFDDGRGKWDALHCRDIWPADQRSDICREG